MRRTISTFSCAIACAVSLRWDRGTGANASISHLARAVPDRPRMALTVDEVDGLLSPVDMELRRLDTDEGWDLPTPASVAGRIDRRPGGESG